MKKLPKALRHKKTGAVEYINTYGTYRAKGCNGSAYGYKEHYKLGYRPIDITFHDFVVGLSFSSSTPEELKEKGYLLDLESYKADYNTGYNGLVLCDKPNKKGKLRMSTPEELEKVYEFTFKLVGKGDTAEEALNDAVDSFCKDPCAPHKLEEIKDYSNEG